MKRINSSSIAFVAAAVVIGLLNASSTVRAETVSARLPSSAARRKFNAAARRSPLSKGRRSNFTTR